MDPFEKENSDLYQLLVETRKMDPGQWMGPSHSPEDEDDELLEEHELGEWRCAIETISFLISSALKRILVPGGLYRYTYLKWGSDAPSEHREPILIVFVGWEQLDESDTWGSGHDWDHVFRFVSQDGKPWTMGWSESMCDSTGEDPTETLFSENNQCFQGMERIERIA
jgi:hypothetical protein